MQRTRPGARGAEIGGPRPGRAPRAMGWGALGGLLIPVLFQLGYAIAEGAWFSETPARHWLGLPTFPAVVSGSLIGGAVGLLTTDSTHKTQPAWSPDGRRLAFTVWSYTAQFWTITP